MKKLMSLTLAALMLMSLLTGCGGKKEEETADVDLQAFFEELQGAYEYWDDTYLVDIESEMLESYYPGLSEIETEQFIAKAAMMSAVVNEVVFMQCKTEEDAAKAAGILQERVDTQAEGGAWYPESMEAWGKAAVIQHGTYVAMIASAEQQSDAEERFNALFA